MVCCFFLIQEPRAGHWGKWGSWGSCSVSCDEGMKSRTRTCDDPSPKNGGDDCPGASESKTTCVLKSCNAGKHSKFYLFIEIRILNCLELSTDQTLQPLEIVSYFINSCFVTKQLNHLANIERLISKFHVICIQLNAQFFLFPSLI